MNSLLVFFSWLAGKRSSRYEFAPFGLMAIFPSVLRWLAAVICLYRLSGSNAAAMQIVSGCISPCLLVMVLVCSAAPAHASIEAMSDFSKMDSSRFRWLETQAVHLRGVPAYWREFTSQAPAFQAAKSIAQYSDRFQRVMAFKDSVLLSGVRADWHWVAQIQSTPGGSRGRVSMLRVNGQELEASSQSPGNNHISWLAHNARLDFSQESVAGGRRVTQQVYGAALPVDQITAYVQQSLRNTGWRIEPQIANAAGPDVWRRNTSRLLVVSLPLGRGSTVFLNHVE